MRRALLTTPEGSSCAVHWKCEWLSVESLAERSVLPEHTEACGKGRGERGSVAAEVLSGVSLTGS